MSIRVFVPNVDNQSISSDGNVCIDIKSQLLKKNAVRISGYIKQTLMLKLN